MAETNETTGGATGDQGSKNPASNPTPQQNKEQSLSERLNALASVAFPSAQKRSPGSPNQEPVILEEHVVGDAAGQLPVPEMKKISATVPPPVRPPEVTPPTPPLPTIQKMPTMPPPTPAPAPSTPPVMQKPADISTYDVGLRMPNPSFQSSVSLTPKPLMQVPPTPPKPIPPPVKPDIQIPPIKSPPTKVQPATLKFDPIGQTSNFVLPDVTEVEIEQPKESDTDAAAAMFVPETTPVAPPAPRQPSMPRPLPPPIAPSPAIQSPETPVAPFPPSPKPVPPPAMAPIEIPKDTASTPNTVSSIQRLLSQVKLPERREFRGAADPKMPIAETPKNLGAMVTKPPTDITEARAAVSGEPAPISSVHTLKDDLQHAVREKKMSLVRAVSLEQDKKRDELVEEEFGRKERRRRTFGILFASFLLFALGIAAIFGVYFVMLSHSANNTQTANSIVFAEQSVALPLDNAQPSELKRRISSARQSKIGSLGSITRIVPLYQGTDPNAQPVQATTQQFFTAMGFNAPDNLTHALGSEFFFGLHVVDKNSPIMVIPVTNYDRAFAGMLSWEATMNTDLSPAFTPVPSTILDQNGIPSARVFKDNVMRNYDVRELKDDSGTVQLYYSFPSKNLLIIAESPYSFPELLSRLQSVSRL